jgi:carbamoyl-phosphate synthase small subunit
MKTEMINGRLVLEDGSTFRGEAFGAERPISGEVVFNTGMVGYPEALTDPSYRGQILVLTYPLIGNYGVTCRSERDGAAFESECIQVAGVIVSETADHYSHWDAGRSFAQWLRDHDVPGLMGVDTRAITKRLREKGSMLGKITLDAAEDVDLYDPNLSNLVAEVSVPGRVEYLSGGPRVVLVDCGCKTNIVRSLVARGATVVRVPWDYDFLDEDFDALVLSNGPGDPLMCDVTVRHVRRALDASRPILGVCLGNQLLALAAGARTYKLKFGHRGQNQPCREVGTDRCFITSQNHGFAVDAASLPEGWEPWFVNANDGTNEGIRHRSRPWMSVQFHPEAAPGPVDTEHLFDQFLELVR